MSVGDRILRKFMAQKAKADVLATISNVLASAGSKSEDLQEKLSEYVDTRLMLTDSATPHVDREERMFEEYEQVKQLRPQLKMNKDRTLTLTSFGADK